ncbi:hypothetical protein AB0K64_32735 [Streptomyces sp. NPDC053741]|uniref:hypothetical protein n=1 Tax=Streptomyces TaxID=1883 RepID=UPI003418A1B5
MVALLVVMAGGAAALHSWVEARLGAAIGYAGFTAVVGGGLILFPGEAAALWCALVV